MWGSASGSSMPRAGVPGPSVRLGQAMLTSVEGLTRHFLNGVKGLLLAVLVLGISVPGRSPRMIRSLLSGGGGAKALSAKRIAHADASALEKLWQGWGRNKGLKGWGVPWLCTATGVKCGARGRVSGLSLRKFRLYGSISSAIGTLTAVRELDLGDNQLTGILPSSIGSLSNLQSLSVDANKLNGSLPPSIGKMSKLQFLNLTSNKLTGNLPPSVGAMVMLRYLGLRYNKLTGSLPSDIGGMISLEYLNLSSHQLNGSLPSSLGNMISLQSLDLRGNQLSGSLPSSLGNMTSLQSLDLRGNQLSGSLPHNIGSMISLAHLDLSNNTLAGETPVSLLGLWGLTHLDLGYNSELKPEPSFLSGLAGLSRLQHLGLALPRISADFGPLSLPLRGLSFLSFGGADNVSGTIPQSAFTSSLKKLNLQGTAMQGVLPSDLALLSGLSVLGLPGRVLCPPMPCGDPGVYRNQAFCARCVAFCASCPPGLGFSPTPAGSFKEANLLLRFQEESRVSLWEPHSFDGVTLDGNGFVRAISFPDLPWPPDNLRFDLLRNTSLRTLIFTRCESGTLSESLSYLSSLRMLKSSSRGAMLPRSLSRLRSLSALSIALIPEGGLPSTLRRLRSLDMSNVRDLGGLDLKYMSLNPESYPRIFSIPKVISYYTKLTQLDLSYNELGGSIPSFLSSLRSLANLDLSGNLFEGTIPASLSLLTNLIVLNLGTHLGSSRNRLSLPSGLATLPLAYLIVDNPKCLKDLGHSPCPQRRVNPNSPFCTHYCPQICNPCYSPPPPSYPSPPPLVPLPPSLPPPAPPSVNVAAIAGAACAAGVLVLLVASALGFLLLRKQRPQQDGIDKRGVRSLTPKEVDGITGSLSLLIGGEGATKLYGGETAQGEGVRVRVSESGRGRSRQEAEKAFRNEVWFMSGIHHRHLQELYGCCLTPGKLFLVFKSPEPGSLWGLLRGDPECLTWPQRLRIALTAALGLEYLHCQLHPPVVHRDVKSRTILVTPEFEARVGAAGLGALEFGDEGSLGYADPSKAEQGSPTTKSDVYAFGVVLLELATGLLPLEGPTHILTQVLRMTASDEELERGMPPELRAETQRAEEEGGPGHCASDITEVRSTPVLNLEAFKCFLKLGISCCSFKPQDRPTMARVSYTIEELLQGESLPVAPFPTPGEVPFPEYADPLQGPLGPTQLLAISFTADASIPAPRGFTRTGSVLGSTD